MKLTFLGATHEVTGSCTMVECCGTAGLVDCGMEQGKDCFENQSLPVSPAGLDFVLLTHAHIDHSGLLPLLTKNGFRGRIYATEETAISRSRRPSGKPGKMPGQVCRRRSPSIPWRMRMPA